MMVWLMMTKSLYPQVAWCAVHFWCLYMHSLVTAQFNHDDIKMLHFSEHRAWCQIDQQLANTHTFLCVPILIVSKEGKVRLEFCIYLSFQYWQTAFTRLHCWRAQDWRVRMDEVKLGADERFLCGPWVPTYGAIAWWSVSCSSVSHIEIKNYL